VDDAHVLLTLLMDDVHILLSLLHASLMTTYMYMKWRKIIQLQKRKKLLAQKALYHLCMAFLLLFFSLENWYYRILVFLTGYVKNAELAVDALSIW
jgi:hypothetical protein